MWKIIYACKNYEISIVSNSNLASEAICCVQFKAFFTGSCVKNFQTFKIVIEYNSNENVMLIIEAQLVVLFHRYICATSLIRCFYFFEHWIRLLMIENCLH